MYSKYDKPLTPNSLGRMLFVTLIIGAVIMWVGLTPIIVDNLRKNMILQEKAFFLENPFMFDTGQVETLNKKLVHNNVLPIDIDYHEYIQEFSRTYYIEVYPKRVVNERTQQNLQ